MNDYAINADMPYEEAAGLLEAAVDQLEKGNLTLEQSLLVFEKAMGLVRHCNGKLDEIEKRITMLVEGKEGIKEKEIVPEDIR